MLAGEHVVAAEVAHGLLGVLRAHDRLADEDGVHADPLELVDLLAARVAGLGDHGLAGRYVGDELLGRGEVDLEAAEIRGC